MSVDNFIPEVWSSTFQTKAEKTLVLGTSVNRDYEGEFSQAGDTVRILELDDPVIGDYIKNVTRIEPHTLSGTETTVVIDQSKYFAFEVDDVDKRQAQGGDSMLSKAAARTAYLQSELMDAYIGAMMVAGAGNKLDPITVSDPSVIRDLLIEMRTVMNRAGVPRDQRWVAISPEIGGLLLKDDLFISADKYGSGSVLQNGEVGRIFGFTVKESNHLPVGAGGAADDNPSNWMIAGTNQATTFAQQISKTEAYRPQDSFSDAIKGLNLYGAKVVRPDHLAAVDVEVNL